MWVSNLHVMSSDFVFYLQEYLMEECCTGDIDLVWHKHWTETICVGQWPIFMLQWFCLFLEDYLMDKCHNWNTGSMWKDLPRKMYVGQWPTFHSPVILSYILKTIWWINVILEILIQCDTNIELKVYIKASDLYFMVQWFCLISCRLFMDRCHNWNIGSIWCKD